MGQFPSHDGILDHGQKSLITCEECKQVFVGHINVKTIKGIHNNRCCKKCDEERFPRMLAILEKENAQK